MDTIMAATLGVRNMFGEIAQGRQPRPVGVASDQQSAGGDRRARPPAGRPTGGRSSSRGGAGCQLAAGEGPDWQASCTRPSAARALFRPWQYRRAVEPVAGLVLATRGAIRQGCSRTSRRKDAASPTSRARRSAEHRTGRRAEERAAARESTIRVDTARLDQVLNLSGEIGLTKNRLTSLRADILAGKNRRGDTAGT
jgi:two-component system chemotaxis sensor kinase CheA